MTGTVKTDRQTNRAKHIQRFKDRIRTVRMRTDGELDGSTFGWFWVLKNSDHKTSPSFRCGILFLGQNFENWHFVDFGRRANNWLCLVTVIIVTLADVRFSFLPISMFFKHLSFVDCSGRSKTLFLGKYFSQTSSFLKHPSSSSSFSPTLVFVDVATERRR